LVDIVSCIVEIFKETELLGEDWDIMTLEDKQKRFSTQHADKVVDLSKRNPMFILPVNAPLVDALKIIRETGAHRILIHKEKDKKKIVNVLTQSAIVSWLDKHSDSLGPVLKLTIRELNLGVKGVICIKDDSPALEGFKLMASNRISAVGIVDKNGTLISAISAKDIRVLDSKILFSQLYKSALEFVIKARNIEKSEMDKKMIPQISATPDTTLGEVLKKLASFKIHRIFVVDSNKKALGVISLGDLLTAILQHTALESEFL